MQRGHDRIARPGVQGDLRPGKSMTSCRHRAGDYRTVPVIIAPAAADGNDACDGVVPIANISPAALMTAAGSIKLSLRIKPPVCALCPPQSKSYKMNLCQASMRYSITHDCPVTGASKNWPPTPAWPSPPTPLQPNAEDLR
jgi:hypothetical protein